MYRIILTLLLVALLLSSSILIACSSEVTFPDPNLEAAIREAIGKPEGSIYKYVLEVLTTLEAQWIGISDLTGLEYCVNLRELVLAYNNISDISPLASLTNLDRLDLNGNNIRERNT